MISMVSQSVPLELMNSGERGVVVEVSGQTDFGHRLEEMGIRPGALICVVRSGSPCIVEVNRHKFSIRCEETTTVLVDVEQ